MFENDHVPEKPREVLRLDEAVPNSPLGEPCKLHLSELITPATCNNAQGGRDLHDTEVGRYGLQLRSRGLTLLKMTSPSKSELASCSVCHHTSAPPFRFGGQQLPGLPCTNINMHNCGFFKDLKYKQLNILDVARAEMIYQRLYVRKLME